jgi:diguanylate cyclase (GGDEF)-like protein
LTDAAYNLAVLPRVLVADDDPTTVLLISSALRGEYEVVVASSGAAALERADAFEFDLFLLDVGLPDFDGFEVCRRLKERPHAAQVPVIFVTAHDQTADEARGFAVGAVDYIAKPIRSALVRARVRTHVDLKRSRDALLRLAMVDGLTGIANRRSFDEAISREWRRGQRKQTSCWMSLALVDVDHFKQFNDKHGHLAGDECLKSIARALAGTARRAGEVAARYGGEEFAVLLPDVDPAGMADSMQKLMYRTAFVYTPAGQLGVRHAVTVSVGAFSILVPRDETEMSALAVADTLLYEAKASGRNCCVHQECGPESKTVIPGPGFKDLEPVADLFSPRLEEDPR